MLLPGTTVAQQTAKFARTEARRVLCAAPSFKQVFNFFFSLEVASSSHLPNVLSHTELPPQSQSNLKIEPQKGLAPDQEQHFNLGLLCGLGHLIKWHYVSAGATGTFG